MTPAINRSGGDLTVAPTDFPDPATDVSRARGCFPLPRVPPGLGQASGASIGGLRRHAPVFDADAIGLRIGGGASDSGVPAADGRRGELSRGRLYPLRIAARVFALFGIGTLFYVLVLVAIFVQSGILEG